MTEANVREICREACFQSGCCASESAFFSPPFHQSCCELFPIVVCCGVNRSYILFSVHSLFFSLCIVNVLCVYTIYFHDLCTTDRSATLFRSSMFYRLFFSRYCLRSGFRSLLLLNGYTHTPSCHSTAESTACCGLSVCWCCSGVSRLF